MKATKNKLAKTALACAISCASYAHAWADGGVTANQVNIEAGDLRSALSAYMQQTGHQILFRDAVVANKTTKGLSGDYTSIGALQELLKDTNLEASLDQSTGALVIKEKTASPATASTIQDTKAQTTDKTSSADYKEEIVVTGSLLREVTTASHVTVFDASDITRMGAHSLEDVMRHLPQNVSTMNASSSMDGVNEVTGTSLTPSMQGMSMANLRGLGASNTLVLVNGRRRAGTAISNGRATNLSTIPLASVERIEVMLDGASAIYGSDAVGGVINIITKKGQDTSAATDVTYSDVQNGGREIDLSQHVNFSWATGRAGASLSYAHRDPVLSAKAGHTTSDLTSQGGTDFRTFWGVYSSPGAMLINGNWMQLPEGFDGTENWTEADLVPAVPIDTLIDKYMTPEVENVSVGFDVEQDINEDLTVFADVWYSSNKTDSIRRTGRYLDFAFPASNAFNNLGVPFRLGYAFDGEIDSGLLPGSEIRNTDQQGTAISVGAIWKMPVSNWELKADYSASKDVSKYHNEYLNISTWFNPEWAAMLSSSDPSTAFNPFGHNASQPANLADVLWQIQDYETASTVQTINLIADGDIFTTSVGTIRGAVGTEFRYQKLDMSQAYISSGAGAPKPSRDSHSLFGQINVPIVGDSNSMKGVQALDVTLSGRYEKHGDNDVPHIYEYWKDDPFTPVDGATPAEFDNTSFKVDMNWKVSDSFKLAATWGESFVAPSFSETLTAQTGPYSYNVYDWITQQYVVVPVFFGGNPELQPETATTTTLSSIFTPASIEGLHFKLTYSEIDYEDRIKTYRPWPGFTTEADGPAVFGDPRVTERDADGNLTLFKSFPVNLAGQKSKILDFDIGYAFDTNLGSFNLTASGAKMLYQKEQLNKDAPKVDTLGMMNGVPKLNWRAGLDWNRDNYGANIAYNYRSGFYYNSYQTREDVDVGSYGTVDIGGHYTINSDIKVSLLIKNATATDFPFVDRANRPWNPAQVDVRGRIIRVGMSKQW